MPRAVSRQELIRKFRALGYSGSFSGKRHQFMQMGRRKIRIPNPHSGQDIGAGLLVEILRQAGVEKSVWDEL
ncbi:type II toxin-antitoxin system HicA family toxin [uncultured Thiocystis sp.]|uniref:type II toxin-antitoxin system HicA family toxin n=1 Tax=uncultured Thiocystis sp. TaxID=1202134 RepID=UPI0025E1A3D6|nr:type II toxin-antitoxin system HicA family toxin [uncultured Thiocystis sp.]